MSCIAAMSSKNRGIGKDGKLPWRLRFVLKFHCFMLEFLAGNRCRKFILIVVFAQNFICIYRSEMKYFTRITTDVKEKGRKWPFYF